MKQVLACLFGLAWAASSGNAQGPATGRPCVAPSGRVARSFHGEVDAGLGYEQRVGPFVVRLRPDDDHTVPASSGWHLGVFENGRSDDLSQFTPPYAGPNARDLFAWFDAEGKQLNAPGRERTFYFSPEVGRTIRWEEDADKRRANQQRVEKYGRGELDILEYRVGPAVQGVPSVPFTWIKFAGCLTWPVQR